MIYFSSPPFSHDTDVIYPIPSKVDGRPDDVKTNPARNTELENDMPLYETRVCVIRHTYRTPLLSHAKPPSLELIPPPLLATPAGS